MNENSLTHLLKGKADHNERKVKTDVSEKEAMEIYHELINLFAKHDLSYQCATRLSIAWTDALLHGAVELYMNENY